MVDVLVPVNTHYGLDGQASAKFALTAAVFSSDIVCVANGRTVNDRDVMSLVSPRKQRRASVRVLATGPDELAAVRILSDVLCTSENGSAGCTLPCAR